MARCWALAAPRGIHLVHICIYWCATLPTGQWIPTVGEAVVPTRGLSTRENRCGWHSRPLYLRIFIRLVRRLLILPPRLQELLWMMVRQISMRLPMNVGMISPHQARRAALCVHPGRVPPRLPVLPNGFSRRVRTLVFIQSISAFLP